MPEKLECATLHCHRDADNSLGVVTKHNGTVYFCRECVAEMFKRVMNCSPRRRRTHADSKRLREKNRRDNASIEDRGKGT
jgi:hypothetical protein